MNRITLFILGEKGYTALLKIIRHYGHGLIDKVIYASDLNVIDDYSGEIINLCKSESIPFYDRKNAPEIETEYSLAIGWRWLIHTGGEKKIIVLHDSLLPKYRGFAPLVTALINADREIGVTALYSAKEFDRGDIICQKKIEISYPIKIKSAISLVSQLYAELCLEILHAITNSAPVPGYKQDESLASYSVWRNQDDYRINWQDSATNIVRFIDALGYPYLGAFAFMEDKKIRILEAEVAPDIDISGRERHFGKVIFSENGLPVIICGEGLLKLVAAISDSGKVSVLPFNKFRIKLH